MHETRFAGEIVRCIKSELPKYKRVKSVTANVKLSPFSHVSPAGLKGAFEIAAEAEKLENVSLQIEPLPLKVHCGACGNVFEARELVFQCPRCSSVKINVEDEHEFSVDSIEKECGE